MGIYEFMMLSKHDQYDTVYTKGQFVDTVTKDDIKYALYAVSMFWVEVTYKAATNKILKCAPFVHGHALDKYSNVPEQL